MEQQQGTVTVTETETPSRSKGHGMAWIDFGPGQGLFATANGRSRTVKVGDRLVVKAKIEQRRSTRTDVDRDQVTVTVTGDAADSVEITVGSPQPYTAVVTGVRGDETTAAPAEDEGQLIPVSDLTVGQQVVDGGDWLTVTSVRLCEATAVTKWEITVAENPHVTIRRPVGGQVRARG